MKDVAILGAGPAGLLAALAAEHCGLSPTIFAKGEKSEMFGAMYLHRAIPGMHSPGKPDFEIDIIKTGTKEGYAYNVYGDREAPASWDSFTAGSTPAWDLHETYDRLWERYRSNIKNFELETNHIGTICHNYPHVFSSVPAPAICGMGHEFSKQDIWVIHGEGTHLIEGVNDDDMMYYNGVPYDGSFSVGEDSAVVDPANTEGHLIGHDWYRFSQIRRYQAWEYARKPDWAWVGTNPEDDELGRKLSEGIKPLTNNCSCWLNYGNFHPIGRFGRWQKGVLTHHAYEEALGVLRALH